jgi:hypothetical protein
MASNELSSQSDVNRDIGIDVDIDIEGIMSLVMCSYVLLCPHKQLTAKF